MLSWHGTAADGRPTGGVQLWIECAQCGERFGRGAGGVLTTPEAAAEYQQEQARVMTARIEAVYARRAREAAQREASASGAPNAAPDPAA